MASPRLRHLKQRVLRWQLIMGLGFLSLILGMWASFSVVASVQPRFAELPRVLGLLLPPLFAHFWLIAVLPLMALVLARVVAVAPWPTAIGAAATGELFLGAIGFVSGGFEALRPEWPWTFMHALCLGGGIVLTAQTIRAARARAKRADAEAERLAQARQAEYASFLDEAERLASKDKAPTPEREPERGPGEPPIP